MKERNIIVRGGILAAAALLVFSAALFATTIEVTIRPKHLSLSDDNKPWVRCYVSGVSVDEVSADACVLEGQIVAVKVREYNSDGDMGADVVVFFDRDEARAMLSEAGAKGDVELVLSITLENGTVLVGSDTIKVTK